MIFKETRLPGAFVIELERHNDERGFFARSWCRREFENHGLNPSLAQCNISYNKRRGTLRGMHYQAQPHAEEKLVRCTRGAVYDVIVDLRADSPTFKQWAAFELTAENRRMLYIPKGLAHGFLTLADGSELFYEMSEFYRGESTRGVKWNDPAFAVWWPVAQPAVISRRDRSFPSYDPAAFFAHSPGASA
jgi:dTDP-4-dehydrorhamnose 3,5-epimerase